MQSPLVNRSLFSLPAIVVMLSVVIGCSKSSDSPTPTTLTTVEGNWKVNSIKLSGTLDVTSSLTATYGACITDITLSFKAGGAVGFDNPASCANGTALAAFTAATGIDANSKWSQSGTTLTITNTGKQASSYTTTFGTSTVQLQGSGLFSIPPGSAPANYNFTLELRKV